jgi:hypothetical protein
MADDHLVDMGLGELLGFDHMFLGSAEEVVEEGHIQFQDLDKFDEAAIGHVELPVEIEGPRVRIGPEDRDFPVVDVSGELGGILILFIFGLKGAHPDSILLGKNEAVNTDMIQHLFQIAGILLHESPKIKPAGRAKIAVDDHLPLAVDLRVEAVDQRISHRQGEEVQRLLVHGAGLPYFPLSRAIQSPGEGIEGSLGFPRVSLQTFFQQTDDGTLG